MTCIDIRKTFPLTSYVRNNCYIMQNHSDVRQESRIQPDGNHFSRYLSFTRNNKFNLLESLCFDVMARLHTGTKATVKMWWHKEKMQLNFYKCHCLCYFACTHLSSLCVVPNGWGMMGSGEKTEAGSYALWGEREDAVISKSYGKKWQRQRESSPLRPQVSITSWCRWRDIY